MKDSIKGTPDSERTVVVRARESTRVNAIVFITESCARMDCWTGAVQPGFYAFFYAFICRQTESINLLRVIQVKNRTFIVQVPVFSTFNSL